MNWRVLIGVFLVLIIGLCGVGSAGVTISAGRITVDGSYDLPGIYDELVITYGAETVNSSYLHEIEPGIWVVKGMISGTANPDLCYINSSTVTELRLGGSYSGLTMSGRWDFSDVYVTG